MPKPKRTKNALGRIVAIASGKTVIVATDQNRVFVYAPGEHPEGGDGWTELSELIPDNVIEEEDEEEDEEDEDDDG